MPQITHDEEGVLSASDSHVETAGVLQETDATTAAVAVATAYTRNYDDRHLLALEAIHSGHNDHAPRHLDGGVHTRHTHGRRGTLQRCLDAVHLLPVRRNDTNDSRLEDRRCSRR